MPGACARTSITRLNVSSARHCRLCASATKDVLQLAGYFLEENSQTQTRQACAWMLPLQAALLNHRSWSGNVRGARALHQPRRAQALSRNDGSASRAGTRLRIVTLGLCRSLGSGPRRLPPHRPQPPWTRPPLRWRPRLVCAAAVSAYERQLVSSSLARHRQQLGRRSARAAARSSQSAAPGQAALRSTGPDQRPWMPSSSTSKFSVALGERRGLHHGCHRLFREDMSAWPCHPLSSSARPSVQQGITPLSGKLMGCLGDRS